MKTCHANKFLFFLAIAILLGLTHFSKAGTTPALSKNSQWFYSQNTKLNGVILLLHGLNLNPEKMLPLAYRFNQQGFHVLNGSLSGHRGNEDEFRKVSRELWLSDMDMIFKEANAKAQQEQLPLYFIGYSLGATIAIDYTNSNIRKALETQTYFRKSIFFAPAISLNIKTLLIRMATYLPFNIIIPSVARKDYRANENGTPIAGYSALFDSINHIKTDGVRNPNPTLIIIDPDDELVSLSGIKTLIQSENLTTWSILTLDNYESPMTEGKYHHLIIDSLSLGEKQWEKAIQAILNHFRN